MRRAGRGLDALRDRAVIGVEDLIAVVGVGRTLGVGAPTDSELRGVLAEFGQLDVARLSADARTLAAVHRAVADQLHRLPEQRIRLDHGWAALGQQGGGSAAGARAIALVISHQREAEADLSVLRSVAQAATAAAAAIDQILRTWYVTVARLSTPVVAGVALAQLPAAVLSGKVALAVVVADIASRVALLQASADAARRGIASVVTTLTRSVEAVDLTGGRESEPALAQPPARGALALDNVWLGTHTAPGSQPTPLIDDVESPTGRAHPDEPERAATPAWSGHDAPGDLALTLSPGNADAATTDVLVAAEDTGARPRGPVPSAPIVPPEPTDAHPVPHAIQGAVGAASGSDTSSPSDIPSPSATPSPSDIPSGSGGPADAPGVEPRLALAGEQ